MRRAVLLLLVVLVSVLLAHVQADQKIRVTPDDDDFETQDLVANDVNGVESETTNTDNAGLNLEEIRTSEEEEFMNHKDTGSQSDLEDEELDEEEADSLFDDDEEEDIDFPGQETDGFVAKLKHEVDQVRVSVDTYGEECFIKFDHSNDVDISTKDVTAKLDGKEVKLKLNHNDGTEEKIKLKFDSEKNAQDFSAKFDSCTPNPFTAGAAEVEVEEVDEDEDEDEDDEEEQEQQEEQEVPLAEELAEEAVEAEKDPLADSLGNTEQVVPAAGGAQVQGGELESEEEEGPFTLLERLAARRRSSRSIRKH